MSCEVSRERYFKYTSLTPKVKSALGGGKRRRAMMALMRLYDIGCQQTAGTPAQEMIREAQAMALIREITKLGLRAPIHSRSGRPNPRARRGYALVYQVLTAARAGGELPPVASAVVRQIESLPEPKPSRRLPVGMGDNDEMQQEV